MEGTCITGIASYDRRTQCVGSLAVETLDCRPDGSGSSPNAGAYFFVFSPESTPLQLSSKFCIEKIDGNFTFSSKRRKFKRWFNFEDTSTRTEIDLGLTLGPCPMP